MLKVRAMGTVQDIEWFSQQIEKDESIEVLDHSEIMHLQGTNKYYRKYFQVQEKEKNTSEVEE